MERIEAGTKTLFLWLTRKRVLWIFHSNHLPDLFYHRSGSEVGIQIQI